MALVDEFLGEGDGEEKEAAATTAAVETAFELAVEEAEAVRLKAQMEDADLPFSEPEPDGGRKAQAP